MKNSATERDGSIGLKIICRHRWEFDVHLNAISNDDCIKNFVVVHDIQLVDSSNNLAVEGKDQIAFHQSAVLSPPLKSSFPNHEELMAR